MSLLSKKIVVTGAEGFIGSHLVESLCAEGASVRALCQYNSMNDWGWLDGHRRIGELELLTGDIAFISRLRAGRRCPRGARAAA